jgi:glucose/arabinose dehydrogenase
MKLALGAAGLALAAAVMVRPQAAPPCDRDNGLIRLPPGFCARVFADYVGVARHMVVAPNGDLYVSLIDGAGSSTSKIARLHPDSGRPGVIALRDTNGDGRADRSVRVEARSATGIALHGGWLYLAGREVLLRFAFDPRRLGVSGPPDTVVTGFPEGGHNSKSLAFDDAGNLFVSVGSLTNACRLTRTETAPDPCPELAVRSGIWRYSVNRLKQRHPEDGERWASGIRNAVGLAWSSEYRGLYATSHGRDGLFQIWGQYFTAAKSAETPSEEFMRVERGDDYGWPYCYHDRELAAKLLAPEYGGDGKKVERCAAMKAPLLGFPGHWGPNALAFYSGTMFPPRYRGGAFIAFHGSWNRLPLREQGYNVVFAPFRDGRPTGDFEVFADGFAGDSLEPIVAIYRPTGLAVAGDGALFISDDQRGRIWRVIHRRSGR